MKTTKLLLSGAILTALTACGGGGSDNTPADPQTPAVPKSVSSTPQNNNSGSANPHRNRVNSHKIHNRTTPPSRQPHKATMAA